jgi:hypothetical protein
MPTEQRFGRESFMSAAEPDYAGDILAHKKATRGQPTQKNKRAFLFQVPRDGSAMTLKDKVGGPITGTSQGMPVQYRLDRIKKDELNKWKNHGPDGSFNESELDHLLAQAHQALNNDELAGYADSDVDDDDDFVDPGDNPDPGVGSSNPGAPRPPPPPPPAATPHPKAPAGRDELGKLTHAKIDNPPTLTYKSDFSAFMFILTGWIDRFLPGISEFFLFQLILQHTFSKFPAVQRRLRKRYEDSQMMLADLQKYVLGALQKQESGTTHALKREYQACRRGNTPLSRFVQHFDELVQKLSAAGHLPASGDIIDRFECAAALSSDLESRINTALICRNWDRQTLLWDEYVEIVHQLDIYKTDTRPTGDTNNDTTTDVFVMDKRDLTCHKCGKKGHFAKECRGSKGKGKGKHGKDRQFKGKSKGGDRQQYGKSANQSHSGATCWTCDQKGHISKNCPQKQRRGQHNVYHLSDPDMSSSSSSTGNAVPPAPPGYSAAVVPGLGTIFLTTAAAAFASVPTADAAAAPSTPSASAFAGHSAPPPPGFDEFY